MSDNEIITEHKTKIVTNNHLRDIVYGWELTDKERKEFDYYTDERLNDAMFFRYKGNVYDLGEFMRVQYIPEFKEWAGYASDSFFSGVLVRFPKDEYDNEHVIVGWYYS